MMIINKCWAMPNKETFKIKPIHDLLKRYINTTQTVVDPFAGNNYEFATISNDLNTEFKTDYHMDSLKFLKLLPTDIADVALFDPPYSPRQVSESYKHFGIDVTKKSTQSSWRAKQLDEITRILKPHGILINFGWNTNGAGKKRGFNQVEILIVAHGASHNDTLVTVECLKEKNNAKNKV